MQTKFLRRPAVEAMTGLGRSTIYQMMNEGRFPRAVRIGLRAVAWSETEVNDWLSQRVAARNGEIG